MQNVIKREVTIHAPKERVYQAIADVDQITKWFPDGIEGKLAVGERPILNFGEFGKSQIFVEAAEPHEYFAYRWIPGAGGFLGDVLTQANTLVEFRIKESDGVSTLTLTETGFATMPAKIAEERFNQNSGGWDYMLDRLEKQLA
jgi:uncharacterized protein YndB with AHSA1/START domain